MFTDDPNALPLPRNWPKVARTAVLHAISLASTAIGIARGWWLNSRISRVRRKAEIGRLREEIALLREELRIKERRTSNPATSPGADILATRGALPRRPASRADAV